MYQGVLWVIAAAVFYVGAVYTSEQPTPLKATLVDYIGLLVGIGGFFFCLSKALFS